MIPKELWAKFFFFSSSPNHFIWWSLVVPEKKPPSGVFTRLAEQHGCTTLGSIRACHGKNVLGWMVVWRTPTHTWGIYGYGSCGWKLDRNDKNMRDLFWYPLVTCFHVEKVRHGAERWERSIQHWEGQENRDEGQNKNMTWRQIRWRFGFLCYCMHVFVGVKWMHGARKGTKESRTWNETSLLIRLFLFGQRLEADGHLGRVGEGVCFGLTTRLWRRGSRRLKQIQA